MGQPALLKISLISHSRFPIFSNHLGKVNWFKLSGGLKKSQVKFQSLTGEEKLGLVREIRILLHFFHHFFKYHIK